MCSRSFEIILDKECSITHQRKIHVDLEGGEGVRRETGKVSFQRFLANIRLNKEHSFLRPFHCIFDEDGA